MELLLKEKKINVWKGNWIPYSYFMPYVNNTCTNRSLKITDILDRNKAINYTWNVALIQCIFHLILGEFLIQASLWTMITLVEKSLLKTP